MAKTLDDVRKFLNALKKEVLSKDNFQKIGEEVKEIVYRRVKSGFGVNSDETETPTQKRLKPLSKSYVEQRKDRGVKGQFATPGASNLTNTGQMLDSIQVRATNDGVTISIPDTPRSDTDISNKKVAEYVADERPFFALTSAEIKIVDQMIRDQVRKKFDSIL